MRVLSENEIQQVSGAGLATDLLNEILDSPARKIGSSIGTFAVQRVHTATSAVSEFFSGVSFFVGGVFNR
ncbi:hypothetical protein HLB02_23310 [Serratia nevei]|nr:hypothetical protein [Serratia nevei]